ncbi:MULTISPECIES: type VII toxin-antitoxin system HepT family RNase toxin [unclassified Anabaena]|uniref:type VII toxin-antitoxin system HepT family RNase toxin n=1 Tax=unclassified Anabaena TaxID=2619674 RepID=UPI0039C70866
MSNIDTEIVLVRLKLIAKYYNTLNEFRSINLDEFLNDFRQQLVVQRLLQLMTQAAIDINEHILSRLSPGNSATNFEAFIEVSKYQVITPELARQIAPSSGLRNRLVHEYDEIDPQEVFNSISLALQQYPLYVRQVNSYLISLSQEDG